MTKRHTDLDALELPLYSYSEADYLAGATRGTASRWLSGYRYKSISGDVTQRPPVTKRADIELKGVSFVDLVEVVAIGRLKEIGFSLLDIRRMVENCQAVFNVRHPLASLEFKVGGEEVFVSQGGTLVEILKGRGRRAWQEVLQPFIETLDYHGQLAKRWWPLGKSVPVLVDPEYGYGFPVIQGSGVRTEIILERLQAGDSREQIAEDFKVHPKEVDSALRFEATLFKRAA